MSCRQSNHETAKAGRLTQLCGIYFLHGITLFEKCHIVKMASPFNPFLAASSYIVHEETTRLQIELAQRPVGCHRGNTNHKEQHPGDVPGQIGKWMVKGPKGQIYQNLFWHVRCLEAVLQGFLRTAAMTFFFMGLVWSLPHSSANKMQCSKFRCFWDGSKIWSSFCWKKTCKTMQSTSYLSYLVSKC